MATKAQLQLQILDLKRENLKEIETKQSLIEDLELELAEKQRMIDNLNSDQNILIPHSDYNRMCDSERQLEELRKLNIELNQANARIVESVAAMNTAGVMKDLSATIVKLTVDKYN